MIQHSMSTTKCKLSPGYSCRFTSPLTVFLQIEPSSTDANLELPSQVHNVTTDRVADRMNNE